MEPNARSSENPDKDSFISLLGDRLMSYVADLISKPLRNGLVYFLAGLIPALIIGWILFPMVLYSKQPQPINFSHALHLDPEVVDTIKGDTEQERCLYCHIFRADGTFGGIPKLETCTECHDDPEFPLGESPDEETLLKDYVAHNKEIPWLVYARQPDNVYFSHIAMVKMGDIACQTCHGHHSETDQLPLYQRNRLSGYSRNIWGKHISGYKANTWDRMKMDDCADCHTKKGFEELNSCFVCHK
jgi:menaquinone reductase, multiheme cytochrome c subunit